MEPPSPLARIQSLLAELRVALAEAPAALEAEAMAAFRAGDQTRLFELMEQRARYAELAARLGERLAPATVPTLAPASMASAVPVRSAPPAPAPQAVETAPVIPVAIKPVAKPVSLPPLPRIAASRAPVGKSAVVKAPAAKAAPARVKAEKPKPEGPLEGKSLAATRARFFADSRTLLAQPGNGPLRTARLKALICLGRALEGTLEGDEKRIAQEEVTSLRAAWNESGDQKFFALNPGRYASAEEWYRLSRAYAVAAEAEGARAALRENREVAGEAIAVFAAIVGFAAATLGLVAPGIPDAELASLRETVKELGADLRAIDVQEGLKRRPEEWARYEGLASGLPALLAKVRNDAAKRQRTEDALEAFARLFREGEANEEFVDRLVAHARDALSAGVRPNNPRLRDPMMPFREAMQELEDPALKPLIEEIKKQERAILTKQKAEIQVDTHKDDPEHEERLAAVRAYLRDKSLGFAGSRKGNDRRMEEFRRTLGAKDLVWPDVEKHHAVGRLVDAVKRCDVVCLLVRFCRHSYKDALDEAKELGGRMVFLPRGLGLHTVVFELYTQLRLGEPSS